MIARDGTFRYTPAAASAAATPSPFTVSDGHGGTATAIQRLTIDPRSNLLVNGSFDDVTGAPVPAAPAGSPERRHGDGPAGPTSPAGRSNCTHEGRVVENRIDPADGAYAVDLNGGGANARIAQTVAGITAGTTYALSVSVANTATAANDPLTVSWGGQTVWTGTPPNILTAASDQAGLADDHRRRGRRAGDGTNQLVIQGAQTGAALGGGLGAAIDAVSLAATEANPNLIRNGGFEDLTGPTTREAGATATTAAPARAASPAGPTSAATSGSRFTARAPSTPPTIPSRPSTATTTSTSSAARRAATSGWPRPSRGCRPARPTT